LSGDWGGTRQDWANKGVTFDLNLTQVTQGVVSGGIDTGWEYSGRGETTMNLDTSKMGLWPGGLITVMGEGNFGNPLTKKTGSLLGTNANDLFPEADNSFVLPQVTLTQFLTPKFGLALGKFATISSTAGDMNEFAHGKGSQQFLNPALSFNPVMALTVPYSTLGMTAIYLPTKELAITAGVVNPQGDLPPL
jgi:porin